MIVHTSVPCQSPELARSTGFLMAMLLGSFFGCRSKLEQTTEPGERPQASRILAQGQILPAGGMIRLSATPGDVVQEVIVQNLGQEVAQGSELVVMRSAALREKELQALRAQLQAAEQQKAQAIVQAESQVEIAQGQLLNAQAKMEALPRQENLLKLAEKQVGLAEEVLQKLERISQDQRTREFVGAMEVDRQEIAVGEARLKYLQQRESYLQTKQDLELALDAAQLELEVAEQALAAAKESTGPDVLKAQIDALKVQLNQSRISAPVSGSVLAIHAKPGETSAQLPLIEMANLENLICEVEINERDAARLARGQKAILTSHAFSEPIDGYVAEVHQLVGQPMLRSVDPLARSDYRTVTAIVRLCETAVASQWLQLQVQVEIRTSEKSNCAPGEPVSTESAPAASNSE